MPRAPIIAPRFSTASIFLQGDRFGGASSAIYDRQSLGFPLFLTVRLAGSPDRRLYRRRMTLRQRITAKTLTIAEAARIMRLRSAGHASDALRPDARADLTLTRFALLCAALGMDDAEIGASLRELRPQAFTTDDAACE